MLQELIRESQILEFGVAHYNIFVLPSKKWPRAIFAVDFSFRLYNYTLVAFGLANVLFPKFSQHSRNRLVVFSPEQSQQAEISISKPPYLQGLVGHWLAPRI